jgi:predicted nucleotidyltransferase
MNKNEVISALRSYFEAKADAFGVEMAFLYGSWATGRPKAESDIDIAIVFAQELEEEKIFKIITRISFELTDNLKRESSVLFIDRELSRPMLYYNAIVHGLPVYLRDFTRFVDMKLKAMRQMEDFAIFGLRWQSEVVRGRLEALKHG